MVAPSIQRDGYRRLDDFTSMMENVALAMLALKAAMKVAHNTSLISSSEDVADLPININPEFAKYVMDGISNFCENVFDGFVSLFDYHDHGMVDMSGKLPHYYHGDFPMS